jgi:hypothetical protein
MGRRNNRRTSDSPLSSGSQIKTLLADEDEKKTVIQSPIVENKDEMEKYWKLFAVEVNKYEYPVEEKVPAGAYYSEIKKMDIRIKNDQVILDVGYWIEDAKAVYRILQSYPAGSIPFKKLRAAIDAAGIDATTDIRTAIGMSEKILLAYVSKKSDIGSIIDRIPCEKLPDLDDDGNEIVVQHDEDDEFDDALEFDD